MPGTIDIVNFAVSARASRAAVYSGELKKALAVSTDSNSMIKTTGAPHCPSEVWPKSNTFGHALTVNFPLLTPATPAETTKVESYHQFTDWIVFGGPVLRSGDPVEQEKRIKYRDLVANAVMLHNAVDMTAVLRKLQQEGICVTPEIVRRLSPYLTEHIKRFRLYFPDMATQPGPLQPQPLFGVAA